MPTSIELMPQPFEWITIPAGDVAIEAGGYLDNRTIFYVHEFQIAKYPITNAQFDAFINHFDGYSNPKWWNFSDEAYEWRANRPQMNKSHFDGADNPRDSVSWFDSIAFTIWLTEITGESIIVPYEQQWQRAAQGDTGYIYPWGNEMDEAFANYGGNMGKTTPVRQYPKGVSPYDVMDMAGNVREWCATGWYNGNQDILAGSDSRILRGGSWFTAGFLMRSSFRFRLNPDYIGNDNGFRCVRLIPNIT